MILPVCWSVPLFRVQHELGDVFAPVTGMDLVRGQEWKASHLQVTGSPGINAIKSKGSKLLVKFFFSINNPVAWGEL